MILPQFQVTSNRVGDILIAGGWVIQPRQGVALQVGEATPARDDSSNANGDWWPAVSAQGLTYLTSGGTVGAIAIAASSGWIMSAINGTYYPASPDPADGYSFTGPHGPFFLRFNGDGTAVLYDGVADVSTASVDWTSGSTGFLPLTQYGKDTYNGGLYAAVTIADVAPVQALPSLTISIPSGLSESFEVTYPLDPTWGGGYITIPAGVPQLWTLAGTSATTWGGLTMWGGLDVTLSISGDGSAGIYYNGILYASRAVGHPYDPSGLYTSTTAGGNAWNDGNPWNAWVAGGRSFPRAGWVYLRIEDVAGTLTSVSGPFFAATLPAPTGNFYAYPLAKCSGTAPPEQLHLGPVQWGHTTGTNGTNGADGTGLPWVVLTEAAYLALSPPDAGTIYDVTP